MDAMTGLVVPTYVGMSSSLPMEVKTARHSNPVESGFYSNGINAVLFFIKIKGGQNKNNQIILLIIRLINPSFSIQTEKQTT
jgi:hypothetical protein